MDKKSRPKRHLEWTPERLARIDEAFESAPAEEVLAWGFSAFGSKICLATSFGPQSIVLVHMISKLQPGTTAFYLDTDLLFPETYRLRDQLSERLGVTFTRVGSELTIEDQSAEWGPRLWERDPDHCCKLRKVMPLRRFLSDKKAWITGIRNGHSSARARTPTVGWDAANGVAKLNPLVRWEIEQIWDYLRSNDLPFNPLHLEGYPSIGCQPCTRPVRVGEDPRSGRWPGFAKSECGIHQIPRTQVLRLEPRPKESVR